MAARVEPPRPRAGVRDVPSPPPVGWAGREVEPYSPALASGGTPPPPLWVMPSELPPEARSQGFVDAYPTPGPPLPPAEGLFDVPGLLERLWLARALEASHRERSGAVVAAAPAGLEVPLAAPASEETPASISSEESVSLGPEPPAEPALPDVGNGPAVEAPRRLASNVISPATLLARPRGWICPTCYLTNDPDATTCRGCRSAGLHLAP